MQADMLARSRTITVAMLAAAAAVSVASLSTFDAARAIDSLPELPFGTHDEVGSAPAIAAMDATGVVQGRFLQRFNEDRLEAQLERAPSLLASSAGRRAPGSIPSLRGNRQVRAMARALAAIPASELDARVAVTPPRDILDPWSATIRIDLRDIAGAAPAFERPGTTLRLVLRPVGIPGRDVVRRWHVERASFGRGGLLRLAPIVATVRAGPISVSAPRGSSHLARTVATELVGMLPGLQRDYPGLRARGRGVYVVLAPSPRAAADAISQLGPTDLGDASGVAVGDRHVALDLPRLRAMPEFERRALLRHELAHIVTHRLTITAGDTYAEGLAEWEGDHEIVRSGSRYMINGDAVDRVEDGRIDLDRMLFTPVDFDALDGSRWAYYRFGTIVVDYMERTHGHARTMRFYRHVANGGEHRGAVRRAFGMSPEAFRRDVAAWASSHRTWHG